MTLDQIFELIHAGYTKDEINALSSPTSAPAVVEEPPADAAQVTAQTASPEITEQEDPTNDVDDTPAPDDSTRWATLLAEIADMKKAIHGQNIRRGVDTPPPKAIEDELADQWISNGQPKK